MVLLTTMMRTAAVTGRTDFVPSWVAGRQSGVWAERTVRAVLPPAKDRQPAPPSPADPAETLRQLTQLHQAGVLTDAEFEQLRTRVGA